MRVGIGLPSAIPGRSPDLVAQWAERAEAAGFSSLGVLDRVNYAAFEPLVTLASAAAVTENIRLVTMVVIGPLHNPVLLARQAASLDALSGGRLTLGLGVGARVDDYEHADVRHRSRGKRLTEQLDLVEQCLAVAEDVYAKHTGKEFSYGRRAQVGEGQVETPAMAAAKALGIVGNTAAGSQSVEPLRSQPIERLPDAHGSGRDSTAAKRRAAKIADNG